MILRDRDVMVDLDCDNFRWPFSSSVSSIFVHNGGSASSPSTRCPRWPKCDYRVNKFFFFITEGNQKLLIHKEKSRFPFSSTAHRDFEIFKKAVLDFCGVQWLAEPSVLELWKVFVFVPGNNESENEMALIPERDSTDFEALVGVLGIRDNWQNNVRDKG